ncbi:fumarylacetoacetate hydrolase family protein [Alicyclobacillus tolerans]|uniref:fumarylacetoacetate hydrolase family protein n=1 Tax=Alicyclobacillus tolerans TaxID=90970 RepID=UPI001F400C65|nr:fumarylacetoacetate hydrolase family protein [Alicyclobacillus tolerans]MCF8565845.1 fumarylacetoacetate hydrolase family protein [Alicyclobacillus tolerans]
MKFLTFRKNGEYRLGVAANQGVLDVAAAGERYGVSVPTSMEALIAGGAESKRAVLSVLSKAQEGNQDFLAEETIEYGPSLTRPEKIICVGTNYRKHAEESNMPIPTSPVLFSKFNNTLAGHQSTVKIPSDTKKADYEVELVIVMGKTAQDVSEDDALNYVFGYATGNDLSARDLQFRTVQWLLGKSSDGFAPVGPYVVTADEVPDPNNLNLECRVNGEVRQSSNTRDMIFDCKTLVSYISRYMTLKPGDLIFTGTPEGVIFGYPEEKQVWLKSGDEVITEVHGLGALRVVME